MMTNQLVESDSSMLHNNEQKHFPSNKGAASTPQPVSDCSDLYFVSPPLHNHMNENINKEPLRIRDSLTPPPFSEKINRAIRTAEHNLDAAVNDVHRYISQGCPDSDTGHKCSVSVKTPESEYSDDFMSPKVLPDFNSPLNAANLAAEFQFNDSNVENEEANILGNDYEEVKTGVKESSNGKKTIKDDFIAKPQVGKLRRAASPYSIDNIENESTTMPGMKGRILRFDGSKFRVWPPLNGFGSSE